MCVNTWGCTEEVGFGFKEALVLAAVCHGNV